MSKRITFERIKNPNITGYAIFIKDNGALKKIGIVENPNKENPIKIVFNPTSSDIISITKLAVAYQIKHKSTIANIEGGVAVAVNGEKISDSIVSVNTKEQSIIIYTEIKTGDEVTISYYIDGIEYFYDSNEDNEYIVKALFNEFDMTVGKHYQLI